MGGLRSIGLFTLNEKRHKATQDDPLRYGDHTIHCAMYAFDLFCAQTLHRLQSGRCVWYVQLFL